MGIRDCEAGTGSRKIENPASLNQRTPDSNPGIIVVPATGGNTAIIVIDAQITADAKV